MQRSVALLRDAASRRVRQQLSPSIGATRSYRKASKLAEDDEGVVIGKIRHRSAGKFIVTLDSGHEVTATRAGRMRSEGRKLLPGQRVQVLFDLEAEFDEQTPKIVGLVGAEGRAEPDAAEGKDS
ncbi:hypothetical protein KFE25_007062 [Diacronema lutheri]|uniref:Uncharacterized protein n=1 Tax=Diacronema lutheri TaxID=2081491 RepID=A0A7R9UHR9_DIALT|nr:hypothetical protein KFE25_007062 [Diacronema lutheri]